MTGANPLLTKLKTQFDDAVVPVLTTNSVGRQLMPINPTLSGQGLGVLTVETLQYVARGSAITNYDIQKDIEDMVDITSFDTRVPVQQDMVRIKYRDWLAYQRKKIPIQNDISTDMTAKIVAEQDKVIAMGWKPQGTTYLVKGLYQVAGNTVSVSDSGTYGNVKKGVVAAIAKLKEDGVYSAGYNLSLASFNFSELDGSESTTSQPEFDQIMKILNRNVPGGGQPGQIYEVPDLVAGTGMVTPVASQANLRYFDIVELQVPENDVYQEGGRSKGDIIVEQVGALVPRFKHLASDGTDVCVCTMTGMGSS